MSGLDRRDLLRMLAAAPLPAALGWSSATVERAVREVRRAAGTQGGYRPRFFSAEEWETVRILADLIIPRDDRSGSATDAQAPEFIDYVLSEGSLSNQTATRGGLAWLDRECRARWSRPFRELAAGERTALLDQIAWPARAGPEMSQGVAFFTRLRDQVAGAFWSSRIGVDDLGYQGNTFVARWTGCPEAQLRKLNVRSGG